MLNRKQIAEHFSVSVLTIDLWRSKGMPTIKKHGLIFYQEEDVMKWLNEVSHMVGVKYETWNRKPKSTEGV